MDSLINLCSKNIVNYYIDHKKNLHYLPNEVCYNLNLLFFENHISKIKGMHTEWKKLPKKSTFLIIKKKTPPLFKKEGLVEQLGFTNQFKIIKYELYSCFIFNNCTINYGLLMMCEYYNKNSKEKHKYFFRKINPIYNIFTSNIYDSCVVINKNPFIDGKIKWFNIKLTQFKLNEYMNLKNPYVY